ncbi:hypothetical protein C8Q77DRAFT_138846 [Trametes polyzona]|nr:hypothetical protein C8Q77DRAFT_138846 [Trametes polyzona]
MFVKRILENTFIAATLILLAANLAFKLIARATINRAEQRKSESNHRKRRLYNAFHILTHRDIALWSIDRQEVLLEIDSWTRYRLDSAQQWAPLHPGGGVIHLGPDRDPYTVSMMHQLRCLDVVRDQLNRPKSERSEQPTRHCMNYLRQMLLCRGDLQLDPYQYPHKVRAVHPHAIRRCKDWRVIYDKVGENQRDHAEWIARQQNATSSRS